MLNTSHRLPIGSLRMRGSKQDCLQLEVLQLEDTCLATFLVSCSFASWGGIGKPRGFISFTGVVPVFSGEIMQLINRLLSHKGTRKTVQIRVIGISVSYRSPLKCRKGYIKFNARAWYRISVR
jgi:hypothetical protein